LPKPRDSRFIPLFVVSAKPKTNIRFNGRKYANADEMPVDVRAAYDRAVDDPAELHSGARLAAKLKATIIVNDTQFNHVGELSVDDRHHYHEALEALFPPGIAVSVGAVVEAEKNKSKKVWLVTIVASVVAIAAYVWLRTLFG
jgi:hypothetical protein